MDKKTRLLDLLSLAIQEERRFAAQLRGSEHPEISSMERWSAKDLIAHNAFWKEHRARQIAEPDNEHLTGFRDFDHLNAQVYAEQRSRTWEEVMIGAELSYERLFKQVQRLSYQDLNDPDRYPWTNGRPLWRTIAISGYYHPLSHLANFYCERDDMERADEIHESLAARLQKLDEDSEWRGITLYNLACFYATSSRPEAALRNLSQALELNPGLAEWAKQDNDLAPLHEEPAYQELYERL